MKLISDNTQAINNFKILFFVKVFDANQLLTP